MAKDPICGMAVDEASLVAAEHDGQTFYFCSEHCRKKFVEQVQPAKSTPLAPVSKGGGSASHAPHDHSHHDHGASAVKPSAAAKYTCPMHPEVQQDHPGDCPKCGMALEPQTVTAGTDDEENAELHDMTKRFWIGAALTLPVFILAMAHLIPVLGRQAWVDGHVSRWLQFALTTPVVWWAGWPFSNAAGAPS